MSYAIALRDLFWLCESLFLWIFSICAACAWVTRTKFFTNLSPFILYAYTSIFFSCVHMKNIRRVRLHNDSSWTRFVSDAYLDRSILNFRLLSSLSYRVNVNFFLHPARLDDTRYGRHCPKDVPGSAIPLNTEAESLSFCIEQTWISPWQKKLREYKKVQSFLYYKYLPLTF